MNSWGIRQANIALYILVIISDVVELGATAILFTLMFLRRSIVKTDPVSYLLLANTYIVLFITSPMFIEMSIRSIYGQLHPDSSFDDWGCPIKSYAIYITGCVYFHSFLLQAIYRFCRIVHPTRAYFQSFRLYGILSVGQWFAAALMILPSLIFNGISYLPDDYHCQFGPKDLRGSLLGLSFLFVMPFLFTMIFYAYTMFYVRTRTTALTSLNRNSSIRRDVLILSRLVLLFTFVMTVAFPHVLIPLFYVMIGYQPGLVVSLEWFLTWFSLAAANVIQLCALPHSKKLWKRPARVQPTTRLEQTGRTNLQKSSRWPNDKERA